MNYGGLALESLFRNWKCKKQLETEYESKFKFNIPEDIFVVIRNQNQHGCPLKKRIKDFDGTEGENTIIPAWVIETLKKGAQSPYSQKIGFSLTPFDEKELQPLNLK